MAPAKKTPPSSSPPHGEAPGESLLPSTDSAGTAEAEAIGGPAKRKRARRKAAAEAQIEAQAEAPVRRGRPRKGEEKRQEVARPDEMQRAITLLDQLVEAFGGSRRHVDKLLGTGRSRTSQVLSGRLELKFQHILDVLEVLGIETRAFFEVLYGEEEHTPFPAPLAVVYRQKLRAMGAPAEIAALGPKASEPTALPHFLTEEEVRQLIDRRLFEAFSQVMPKKPA
ncbi:MAG: hypothetical protein ABJC13_19865 [Acidobacteriota bacterium]